MRRLTSAATGIYSMEVALNRLENSELHQRNNYRRVDQGDPDIPQQIAPGIAIFSGEHFLRTLLHQDKAGDVGQPITNDQRSLESWFVEQANHPGKRQRQWHIDDKLIPPGKWR